MPMFWPRNPPLLIINFIPLLPLIFYSIIAAYEATTKEEVSVAPKGIETKIHSDSGFEDLFQGLQWVTQPISQEPPKEVKNEIMNHFEKVNSTIYLQLSFR